MIDPPLSRPVRQSHGWILRHTSINEKILQTDRRIRARLLMVVPGTRSATPSPPPYLNAQETFGLLCLSRNMEVHCKYTLW